MPVRAPSSRFPSTSRRATARRAPLALLLVVALNGVVAAAAVGAWTVGASGSGYSRAVSLGPGPNPTIGTVTGTATKSVPLSWTSVRGATGYTVRRYDTSTGLPSTIGGTCTGTVTATSCTDQIVAV